MQNSLVVFTRGSTAIEAIEAFTAAFDQLNNANITPAQQQSIVDYYTKQFAPVEDEQTGTTSISMHCCRRRTPEVPAGQLHDPFTDFDQALSFDDAHDGSAWSAASAKFNDFFRVIVKRFEFEDALLLDTRGNVVYSAYKGVDLGTNILTGPYKAGDLTDAYNKAGLTRRRLRRRHRLRRLPAGRRTDGLDGVPGRPAGSRRRRTGPSVPDLEDQPADDNGQAVGRVRDGQDRRNLHRRP